MKIKDFVHILSFFCRYCRRLEDDENKWLYLLNCHCMCSCSTNISPYKNFIKICCQNSKRCSNYYFFIFEGNYYFFMNGNGNVNMSLCFLLLFKKYTFLLQLNTVYFSTLYIWIHYLAPLIFDFVLYFKALGHYCTKTMNDVLGFLYPCVPCV